MEIAIIVASATAGILIGLASASAMQYLTLLRRLEERYRAHDREGAWDELSARRREWDSKMWIGKLIELGYWVAMHQFQRRHPHVQP